MPFQNGDTVIFFGQRYGGTLAVRLHLGHSQAQQPRGLAGVGRQDRVCGQIPPVLPRCQCVQCVGVQHGTGPRGVPAEQGLTDIGGALPQPGPGQQNGVPVREPAAQRVGVLRVDAPVGRRAAAAGAAFRRAGKHQLDNRLDAGQIHQPGPAAQSALCAERRRPAVGHAARRGQHTAVAPLVALRHAPGQQPAHQLPCDFALHLASLRK